MATTTQSAGTGENPNYNNGDDWSNPTNITASDDSYATYNLETKYSPANVMQDVVTGSPSVGLLNGKRTGLIVARNFNPSLSGGDVTGIELNIECKLENLSGTGVLPNLYITAALWDSDANDGEGNLDGNFLLTSSYVDNRGIRGGDGRNPSAFKSFLGGGTTSFSGPVSPNLYNEVDQEQYRITTTEKTITLGASGDVWDLSQDQLDAADFNDATFGFALFASTQEGTEIDPQITISIDHIQVVYYQDTFQQPSDQASAYDTTTITTRTVTSQISSTKNNKLFVVNFDNMVNNMPSITRMTTVPFSDMVYDENRGRLLAARNDKGNVVDFYVDTNYDGAAITKFDTTNIAAWYTRGYYNFGSDEPKNMRFHYCDVKSKGNLTMTVYENIDSGSNSFTITVPTKDGTTMNPSVKTPLKRSLQANYFKIKIANASGAAFKVIKEWLMVKLRRRR